MSRSVMIPGPGSSGSTTIAAPTLRLAICSAAWRSVWPGPTASTTLLIPSRTYMRLSLQSPLATIVASVPDARPRASTCHLGAPAFIRAAAQRRIAVVPTQRPTTVSLRTSLLEEANDIVAREYAADLALDDIARRVASSRRQLQRAYAEIGRTTFREHLTAVRMQRAAELLDAGRMSVREVAQRVGYR